MAAVMREPGLVPGPRIAILTVPTESGATIMPDDDSDPTATTKFYTAIPPLPTARPLGATVQDAQVVAYFSTQEGPVEVHMPIPFAKQLASQLNRAVVDAQDPNRPTRQPSW